MEQRAQGIKSNLLLYRLSFRGGKMVTKMITILLSAFAFMLFALGTIGFTYNEVNFAAKGYLNYCASRPCIQIENSSSVGGMTVEQVEEIENTTGLRFAYQTAPGFPWSNFVAIADEKERSDSLDEYWYGGGYHSSANGLAGFEEDYNALGFSLLAGRYPVSENEIAISEVHYRVFQKFGYCNVAKNFVWTPMKVFENGEFVWIYHYEYDKTLPREEAQAIKSYDDMIGKTFGRGDPETDEHAYEYKVVGVVDTHYDYETAKEIHATEWYPSGWLLLSEERKQSFKTENKPIDNIYCTADISLSQAKKLVQLTLKSRKELGDDLCPMPHGMYSVLHSNSFTDENLFIVIVSGPGIFFGIFAALLNGHLMTTSIEAKQKNVGILRSMGASEKAVVKIFLVEAFLIATAIYLLAQLATLAVYYLWLGPWSYMEEYAISKFVYNGWNVLILFVVCYAVPLISTIAPLKKFFKKPIVDNITGNSIKKEIRAK